MKRLLVLLFFIAASCSSGPNPTMGPAAMKVGDYSSDAEGSPVGVIPTALLHDAARNKDVDISIDYPTRGGPFPVIVFSHSYGSSNHAYEPLISYWASNGYVCIRAAHADAGAIRQTAADVMAMPPEQQRSRRGGVREQQPRTEAPPAPQPNPAEKIWEKEREPQWRDRAEDVELVINSLDSLEKRFPELQLKMDHTKIGIAGHAYGAFTVMLLAGMRTFGSPPLQLADPRVRAVIAMSPEGIAANRGTTAESWSGVHIPALYMAGTNERGATESEDAAWRKGAFDNSPGGDKYFVLLQGAGAQSFTGLGGFGGYEPLRPVVTSTSTYPTPQRGGVTATRSRSFDTIKITSLAFWDAYLKGQTAARDLLQPEKYKASFSGAEMSAK